MTTAALQVNPPENRTYECASIRECPHGAVVTDTWHLSLDDALHQAAFEYDGLTWTDASDG